MSDLYHRVPSTYIASPVIRAAWTVGGPVLGNNSLADDTILLQPAIRSSFSSPRTDMHCGACRPITSCPETLMAIATPAKNAGSRQEFFFRPTHLGRKRKMAIKTSQAKQPSLQPHTGNGRWRRVGSAADWPGGGPVAGRVDCPVVWSSGQAEVGSVQGQAVNLSPQVRARDFY